LRGGSSREPKLSGAGCTSICYILARQAPTITVRTHTHTHSQSDSRIQKKTSLTCLSFLQTDNPKFFKVAKKKRKDQKKKGNQAGVDAFESTSISAFDPVAPPLAPPAAPAAYWGGTQWPAALVSITLSEKSRNCNLRHAHTHNQFR
jgi:hypothetical protein